MLSQIELRQGEADRAARTAAEMAERARGWSRSGCGTGCVRCGSTVASGCSEAEEAADLIDGALRVPL